MSTSGKQKYSRRRARESLYNKSAWKEDGYFEKTCTTTPSKRKLKRRRALPATSQSMATSSSRFVVDRSYNSAASGDLYNIAAKCGPGIAQATVVSAPEPLHEHRRSTDDRHSDYNVVTEQPTARAQTNKLPKATAQVTKGHGIQLTSLCCSGATSLRSPSVQSSDYHDTQTLGSQIMGSCHKTGRRIFQETPGRAPHNYPAQHKNPTSIIATDVNSRSRSFEGNQMGLFYNTTGRTGHEITGRGLPTYVSQHTIAGVRRYHEPTVNFSFPQRNHTDPGLCGLANLGNTCFMNSALQCLSHTIPLRDYFKGEYYRDLNFDNPLGSGGQLADSFSNLLIELWDGNKSFVRPDTFKRTFGRCAPLFSGYSQQDSQEFLTFLLDGLHEDVNKACGKTEELKSILSAVNANDEDQKLANEAWVEYLEDDNSKIVHLFQLQLRSQLICGNRECHQVTRNFDSFRCLSLTIPDEYAYTVTTSQQGYSCTIYDCLDMLTQTTGSGEKNWPCEGCNMLVEVYSKTDLWRTPEILVVYFKRFRTTWQGRYKLDTSIYFPIDGLDLSGYTENLECDCYYDLYATINHSGSVHGGHYTSYVKHGEKWYKFSDVDVEFIPNPEVVNGPRSAACTAYVLFYKKATRPSYSRPEHTNSQRERAHVKRHQPDTSFQYAQHKTAFASKTAKPASEDIHCSLPSIKSPSTLSDSESQCPSLMITDEMAGKNESNKNPELTSSAPTSDRVSRSTSSSDVVLRKGNDGLQSFHVEDTFRGAYSRRDFDTSCASYALQCLIGTSSFRDYFIGSNPTHIREISHLRRDSKFMNCFSEILRDMWDGQNFKISAHPDNLMKMMNMLHCQPTGHFPKDPPEFLASILSRLHNELKTADGPKHPRHVLHDYRRLSEDQRKAEKVWIGQSQSRIVDLFNGQLRVTHKCVDKRCENVEKTFDNFQQLSLPVPSADERTLSSSVVTAFVANRCTIDDCLGMMTHEKMYSTDRECPRCKSETEVTEVAIYRAPEVLLLHIQRFPFASSEHTVVVFPRKNLDLSCFVSEEVPSSHCLYDLCATINHYGSTDSGSYIAFARNNRTWYLNDGQDIKQVKDSRKVTDCEQDCAASVLCYNRKPEKMNTFTKVQSKLSRPLLPDKFPVKSCKVGLQSGGSRKQEIASDKSHQVGSTCPVSSLSSPVASNVGDHEAKEISLKESRPDHNCELHGLEESPVENPAQFGLCALPDYGDTSFMNAVLQCLYHSSSLRRHFTGLLLQDTSTTDCQRCSRLTKSFAEVLCDMALNKSGHVSSKPFSAFRRDANNAYGYYSKDAQVFLMSLLQELHEDTNKATGQLSVQELLDEPSRDEIDRDASESWINYVASNDSKIVQLFHGQLQVVIKCASKECDHDVIRTFRTFHCLELLIPDGDSEQPCDLKDCLDLKMKQKPSEDQFCYKCFGNTFSRKEEISISPRYLILSLKRFCSTGVGRRIKVLRHIRFPVKSLDLSHYIAKSDNQHQYKLYATINHAGSVHSGYYTAYVRCGRDWYKLMDNEIKAIPQLCKQETILDEWQNSSVCVLFYKKKKKTANAKPAEASRRSSRTVHYDEQYISKYADEVEMMDTDQQCTGEVNDLEIYGENDSMEYTDI